jgi:hypothetical protein
MAASTALTNVLEEILRVGQDVESQLHKEKILNNDAHGQTLRESSEFVFPTGLDVQRKQLANAAAQLLQLATDPREYLEQLSANVRVAIISYLFTVIC